jgi:hypothetical protein
MAYGYESTAPGYAGSPWMAARSGTTPILEFYRHYFQRYYTGTRSVADVAVLRNWPSMAYSINATYVPATLMEQVLIQHRVPFDLLFDEQFTNLNHYAAVILAGQECVSDAQVKMILDYVRAGGTLVITDNTGAYNERREKRHNNPFLPARIEGKGRIVYVPQIERADKERATAANDNPEPCAGSQQSPRMSPSQWLLPKNEQEIYDKITSALPHGLSLKTEAPLTTTAELLIRPETQETILHFVNFDRQHPLSPFKASVRKQFAGKIESLKFFSPDADEPVSLPFEVSGDQIKFTVPEMRIYSMIVIATDVG